jgi:hypothetical protein
VRLRKLKQILSWDWYKWKKGGYKENMSEGEYGGNIMYLYMKIEK